jgi:hypothetical protein
MHVRPDATATRVRDAHAMAIDTPMRKQTEPVTRLYDTACELLFAAQNLRAAASDRDATPALPATIGCVEATLDALADAIDDMRCASIAVASRGEQQHHAPAVLQRELAALEDALRTAGSVCDRTRERAAPILAQLTLG